MSNTVLYIDFLFIIYRSSFEKRKKRTIQNKYFKAEFVFKNKNHIIIIVKEREKEMEKKRASARCIFQLEYNLSNYMYR